MRAWRVLLSVGIAFGLLALVDAAVFWTPLYHHVLAPDSSTGSFEAAIARIAAEPAAPSRDVLVLGDSRIYNGLDTSLAGGAAHGLRFIDGAVPGTTPRCWPYFVRAIDPAADRFRAVVVPVDTYADDDSALGSLDGNDRPFDLRYIAYRVGFAEAWPLASTFGDWRTRPNVAFDLWTRGPLLRSDLQALLADPVARARELQRANDAANVPHERTGSLAGLVVDFARNTIAFPASVPASELDAITQNVLHVPGASPSYAAYRRAWLGEIVEHYRASGTTVIFVRIPARPAHRSAPSAPPAGSLAALGSNPNARVIPQARYLALERPEFFADHDHLNPEGRARFSALLGADVSAALRQPAQTFEPPIATAPAPPAPWRFHPNVWLGIGTPLRFQSYEYVVFLALLALLFYSLPRGAGRVLLLAASWYFYARWNAWYLVFLLGLTVSDYLVALALERARESARRPLLAAGIAANLAFLGVFKYANFTTGSLAALLGLQHDPWLVNWIVPIGISFHTFQSLSYLIDVYRREIKAVRAPLDYALYIAFFPQLLAGPIVRAKRFFDELYGWRRPSGDAVLRGLGEIALGLIKKAAIADQLATVADAYFANPGAHPGAPAAWSGILAFSLQIYFDFSGYSDIAIGSARLLGFDFPANFRRPYLATSLTDFWRRWHISLSTWLRDYLYIPLGGNRKGPLRTYLNIMLTMLLGGLWHGPNWTFISWGGYHGALLAAERSRGVGRGDAPGGFVWALRVALTFTLVSLGWILFRSANFGEALTIANAAFRGGPGPWLLVPWQLIPVGVALGVAIAQERGWSVAGLRGSPLSYGAALAGLLLGFQLLSPTGESPPFLYFKF